MIRKIIPECMGICWKKLHASYRESSDRGESGVGGSGNQPWPLDFRSAQNARSAAKAACTIDIGAPEAAVHDISGHVRRSCGF